MIAQGVELRTALKTLRMTTMMIDSCAALQRNKGT